MAAPQLLESDRQRLDGIVERMVANGESDDDIRAVVADFKQRYTKSQPAYRGMGELRAREGNDQAQAARLVGKSAQKAGFSGDALRTAIAVAMAESGGNPRAANRTAPDDSHGLWQVNYFGGLAKERTKKFGNQQAQYNPDTNARAAYAISGGGKNWKPWTTYTGGKYKQYLSLADQVVRELESSAASAAVGAGLGSRTQGPVNAAKLLGGTHVGSQAIAKPKEAPKTLKAIVDKMPEQERARKAQEEAATIRYYDQFSPTGRETGIADEAQINAEIQARGRASLSDPYGKVTEMVGRPLQAAIGKHIRNVSLGTSPLSRLMDVLMPGASQDAKDEAVGTWIGVPENVDQAAIMAAIPVAGKAAGFGMKWLDDLVKGAEARATQAIEALGTSNTIEQIAKLDQPPVFIPSGSKLAPNLDPNNPKSAAWWEPTGAVPDDYPATMQGIDPLGLAKLGEKPVPPPEIPQAPKPASTGNVAPKKTVSETPPVSQTGKAVETGKSVAPKPQTKIKAALENASAERQSAWSALQKERRAAKPMSKKSGAVNPITQAEVRYFKAWVKEKGWQAASSVEDFVKHMVELGEEAAHWRRIATRYQPRPGQAAQNASTLALRAKAGKGAFEAVDKQTMKGWTDEAVAKGYNTRDGAERLVALQEAGERPTFSAPESMGLSSRLDELDKQYNRAQSVLHSAIDTSREAEAYAASKRISDEIDRITVALKRSGTQQARDFVARRGMVKDRSFVGLYSEFRNAVDRPLSTSEKAAIKDIAQKFAQTTKEATAAAAKRAKEKAMGMDKEVRDLLDVNFSKRVRNKISTPEFRVRSSAMRGQIAEILARHTAKMRGSMLGGDIVPEVAELAKELSPVIKAYSQLLFDHGITKVQDNLSEVARFLKSNKVKGVEENEVAAVLTGRLRQQSEKPAMSAWQSFRDEVNTLFKSGKEELDSQRRLIEKEAKDAKNRARAEMRASDQAKLKEEMTKVLEEEKARKEYEKAFWKEVQWWQAGYNEQKLKAARLDRLEAKRRWMASAAGRRAQILNRIDKLERNLDVFRESGIITGQKSRLVPVVDPVARQIEIKETALRNRWHKIVNDARRETEKAKWRKEAGWAIPLLDDAFSGTREMIATFDDSFPFNQGGLALFSDPKSWAKGFKDSLRSFSERGFHAVQDEIAMHPRFGQAEAANLFEGGLEDVFGQSRISQAPWFKSFEQAYEGAGAALRLDLFDRWATIMESTGRPLDVNGLTKLADEVKTWTGLGNWGKGWKKTSKLFFALRYRMSQAEVLLGAPLVRAARYWRATGNPGLFKAMIRSYAKGIGTMAMTTLAINEGLKAAGAKNTYIETDPISTNFGRLIIEGRSTMQILPPVTRLVMHGARLWEGKYKTESGVLRRTSDFQGRDRAELLMDYVTSGFHPIIGFMYRGMVAWDREDKRYFDQLFDFTKGEAYEDVLKGLAPISLQAALHLWFDDDMTDAEKVIGTLVNFFIPISPIREPMASSKAKPKGAPPAKATKPPAGAKVPAGVR